MFKKWLICTFLIVYSFTFGFTYNQQVIVSQFTTNLKTAGTYSITGITPASDKIWGNDSAGSLSSTIDFSNVIKAQFSGNTNAMSYTVANSSNAESSLIIPVSGNINRTEVVTGAAFQLTETSTNSDGNPVTSYVINEKYSLPILSVQSLTSSAITGGGIEFKYTESSKTKKDNREQFKLQEFMIRIAKQSAIDTNYDVLRQLKGIRSAATTETGESLDNSQRFVSGETGLDYIDFFVTLDEYGEIQSENTKSGIGLTFFPGSIELLGMPAGNYRMEVYSFRYSKDTEDIGSVVITKENSMDFSVVNDRQSDTLNVLNFSGDDRQNMEATLLSISSTSSTSISVGEIVNAVSYPVSSLNITTDSSLTSGGAVALSDGNIITLDSENKYNGKYYRKYKVSYKSIYTTVDELERQAVFTLSPDEITAVAKYRVYSNVQRYEEFPHQTVIGYFKQNTSWVGTYEIDDKEMNKYSWGYRNVKVANSSTTVASIDSIATTISAIDVGVYGGYTGVKTASATASAWDVGNTSMSKNTIVINKVKGANKGILSGSNKNFAFYTSEWTPELKYNEYTTNSAIKATDTATFEWKNPKSTPYDVVLSEDKVMFRVVYLGTEGNSVSPTESVVYGVPDSANKSVTLPIKYYYTDTNTNPVVDARIGTNLVDFINNQAQRSYIDFVFESGQDEERTANGASFSFSKDNKFIVTGLPRGKYALQIYSIQNADTVTQSGTIYDYKVITYGEYTPFEMGLPSIMTNDFASQNNIFVVNSVNMTEDISSTAGAFVDKVTAIFTTKAQKSLSLTTANLAPRRDEEITGSAIDILATTSALTVTENRQETYVTTTGAINLKAANNVSLTSTATVEYPLDIVLCIDDSGSMGDEITKVKNGLTNFTASLKARGFNVNFNLITFGPEQNSSSIGSTNNTYVGSYGEKSNLYNNRYYAAQFKKLGAWYETGTSDGLTDLQTALGGLNATGGFPDGGENGAYAIKKALDYLSSYGRYLSPQNSIVSHSDGQTSNVDKPGYLKSTKWVIFMTDEYYLKKNQTDLWANGNSFNTPFFADVLSRYGEGKDNPIISGIYRIGSGRIDDIGNAGNNPSDDISDSTYQGDYNDIKANMSTYSTYFKRYELGNNGNNITNILTYAVETIGKVQTWKLTYNSPFNETKGYKRQTVFSLKDLGTVQAYNATTSTVQAINLKVKPILRKVDSSTSVKTDRFYTETLQRIQARFINPHTVLVNGINTNYLDIEDENIVFEALAQSEFKDPLDGKWKNYPIIRGTFVIKDVNTGQTVTYDSNDSALAVTIKDETINSSKWYRVKKKISSLNFKAIFGNNPNLTVDFIASTATDTKTISLDVVRLRDMDAPRINKITMTNTTLANFMRGLRTSTGAALFTDQSITNAAVSVQEETPAEVTSGTGITLLSTTSGLNVKAGDSVEIGLVVEDESITSASAINIVYNNTTYSAIYQGVDGDGASRKTVWSKTIPIVNTTIFPYSIKSQIKYVVADDGLANMKTTLEGSVFNGVDLLGNTTIKPRSNNQTDSNYNPAGSSYSNYYNNKNIESNNTASLALAYLVAFDYNSDLKDTGAPAGNYPNSGGVKYAASTNGTFEMGDGIYTYGGTVYVVNKAGAIMNLTHYTNTNPIPSRTTLEQIIGGITRTGSTFTVDTIFPRASMPVFIKVADRDLNSNSIAIGVLNGQDKPYKSGDTINFNTTISEANFLKANIGTVLTNPTVYSVNGNTFTTTPSSLSNGNYMVSGTAIDLNGGASGSNNDSVVIGIYDRAGNITYVTLNKEYDDSIPNNLNLASSITGGGIRFTSNSSLLLESRSGNNYSIGKADNNYTALIPTTGALNLVDFRTSSNVKITINEGLNAVMLKSYSKSGMPGGNNLSSVVLDRSINDSRTIYTETAYTSNGGSYVVNLNNFLSTVRELVGLKSYKIKTSITGARLNSGGYISNLNNLWSSEIDLSTQSRYSNSATSSAYTVSNNILLPSSGTAKFNLLLTDRLGNTSLVDYLVSIPNNINIIGKKSGYSNNISTKIDNSGTKIKIQSRTE